MPLKPYPYQEQCVERTKAQNTIVNLPTGFGKTLIAARLIEHYLHKNPTKRIAFLVPTRPLVQQQADYCRRECRLVDGSSIVVQQLMGQDQSDWRQKDWDSCIEKSQLLLGTAALFQQAFVDNKFLEIRRFSLIVFDECHNAVGNSPMAAVMRDCVVPITKCNPRTTPRILGLTASFVNGSLQNIERKRQALEMLMLSTIFCPDVKSKFSGDNFKTVHWEMNQFIDRHKEVIGSHVEAVVQNVGKVKDLEKVIKRCSHVFEELGFDALQYYVEVAIVQQVIAKANQAKNQDEAGTYYAKKLLMALPALRRELGLLGNKLKVDLIKLQVPQRSLKLEELIRLLRILFNSKTDGFRGIVFVEQVALVSSLAKQLNDELAGVQCGAVAGTGHQNESERQLQLDNFKSGKIQVLAATATLEEGIDVSSCEFVVRYTSIATTKAHIQGAGRARHRNAKIYYFENNPDLERKKEATMMKTAKDVSLSLGEEDFRSAVSSMNVAIDRRHPFPFGRMAQMER